MSTRFSYSRYFNNKALNCDPILRLYDANSLDSVRRINTMWFVLFGDWFIVVIKRWSHRVHDAFMQLYDSATTEYRGTSWVIGDCCTTLHDSRTKFTASWHRRAVVNQSWTCTTFALWCFVVWLLWACLARCVTVVRWSYDKYLAVGTKFIFF